MLGLKFGNNFLLARASFLENPVGFRKFGLKFLLLLSHTLAEGSFMLCFAFSRAAVATPSLLRRVESSASCSPFNKARLVHRFLET